MGQGANSAFRAMDKRGTHNGVLSYGSVAFPVNVTSISYGVALKTSGAGSQSRNRQTIYPKRAEQGKLSVDLSFFSVQEYIDFVEFIGTYHRKCVSDGARTFPYLRFTCEGVGSKGCDYAVLPESVSVSLSSEMSPAPTIRGMSLTVIRDMLDWWSEQRSSSYLTSSEIVPESRRVTAQDIRSTPSGGRDSAFSARGASQNNRRSYLQNRYVV